MQVNAQDWSINTTDQWTENLEPTENISIKDGLVTPTAEKANVQTKIKSFDKKRSADSLTITQSPIWQNWNQVKNVGPVNLNDAPVLLVLGPDNYWMFGRYGNGKKKQKKGAEKKGANPDAKPAEEPAAKEPKFVAEEATLEGFDMPLKTSPFRNQFDAPGGLKPRKGGYHAWQSRDMENWVHHGPVTESFSKWVTSAEQVDGKTLIYYDFPNDQDPHVYVDEDLFDGEPGKNMGMAVNDPSHGSDAGVIRDLEGNIHVILEDWSPISANKRSWDSPLAAHAVSPDGINNFEFRDPPVDQRTEPTGETGTYKHPHWMKEDPEHYKTNVGKYEIHKPEQEAYGDWAAIAIGGQYYLFGDYDPAGGHNMSVGWFTSPSIDEQFQWCDNVGRGHPDPDVGFANGKFYLVTQQSKDFTSPGPWVETVEARVGVDTDNDQKIDQWTDWAEVKESYDYIKGFSRQVAKTPAKLDISSLPEGFGFQVEMRLTDTTENKSKPMIDSLSVSFSE